MRRSSPTSCRCSAGAAATAPDGSTVQRRCSVIRCIDRRISDSLTSRMRSTRSRRMANVRSESVARRPSAMVNDRRSRLDMPGGERTCSVVGVGRFASDHLNFGTQRFRGDRRSGKQAAARYGRANDIEVGNLFEEFESGGALPGDHAVVIVGVNQRRAGFSQQLRRGRRAGFERWFAKRNFAAVGLHGAHLYFRSVARHHHPGANAAQLRGQRQRRAVISRGVSHDAARGFSLAQGKNGVRRAANFERSG